MLLLSPSLSLEEEFVLPLSLLEITSSHSEASLQILEDEDFTLAGSETSFEEDEDISSIGPDSELSDVGNEAEVEDDSPLQAIKKLAKHA